MAQRARGRLAARAASTAPALFLLVDRGQESKVALDARGKLLGLRLRRALRLLGPDEPQVLLAAGPRTGAAGVRAEAAPQAGQFGHDQYGDGAREKGDRQPAHGLDSTAGRRGATESVATPLCSL